jgi:hypothetical protein
VLQVLLSVQVVDTLDIVDICCRWAVKWVAALAVPLASVDTLPVVEAVLADIFHLVVDTLPVVEAVLADIHLAVGAALVDSASAAHQEVFVEIVDIGKVSLGKVLAD